MESYTAYVLNDVSREQLLEKFPPKYSKVIGHHITVEFDVPSETLPPQKAIIKVIGYADSNDGIEALVVSVNGSYNRPDHLIYHITWSLDPTKYNPKDSNILLSRNNSNRHQFKLVKSTEILTTPAIL